MPKSDTLTQALDAVIERRAAFESEYERISAELAKLRQAENALRAIIENVPLQEVGRTLQVATSYSVGSEQRGVPHTSRRGSRGPRANSTKGRLKYLLEGAGQQGVSQAQIMRALPDAAPTTVNAYLSTMVTSGEVIRAGDFYTKARPSQQDPIDSGEDGEAEGVGVIQISGDHEDDAAAV